MSNSNHYYCCSASSTSNIFAAHDAVPTTFSDVNTDIIRTHILPKLDGPTLASVGCVSSQLHSLSRDDNLWIKICHSNWPSINDPRVRDAIATCCSFPQAAATYRSFFSHCFSSLMFNIPSADHEASWCAAAAAASLRYDHVPTYSTELVPIISAIDIHYMGRSVCSMVHATEGLPTLVDAQMISPTDSSKAPPKVDVKDEFLPDNVTLSWIVIDPARKLAANLSSLRPVLVKPHWQKGHVEMRYSTILAAAGEEMVEFRITVTCQVKDGGREVIIVKEVILEVQDLDGKYLKGKDSLVVLHEAMESRIRRGNGKKVRYEEFCKMRNHRREKANGREINGTLLFKNYVGVLVTSLVVVTCFFQVFWFLWCQFE